VSDRDFGSREQRNPTHEKLARAEEMNQNKSKRDMEAWVTFVEKQMWSPCLPRRLVMDGRAGGVSLCAALMETVW